MPGGEIKRPYIYLLCGAKVHKNSFCEKIRKIKTRIFVLLNDIQNISCELQSQWLQSLESVKKSHLAKILRDYSGNI